MKILITGVEKSTAWEMVKKLKLEIEVFGDQGIVGDGDWKSAHTATHWGYEVSRIQLERVGEKEFFNNRGKSPMKAGDPMLKISKAMMDKAKKLGEVTLEAGYWWDSWWERNRRQKGEKIVISGMVKHEKGYNITEGE